MRRLLALCSLWIYSSPLSASAAIVISADDTYAQRGHKGDDREGPASRLKDPSHASQQATHDPRLRGNQHLIVADGRPSGRNTPPGSRVRGQAPGARAG